MANQFKPVDINDISNEYWSPELENHGQVVVDAEDINQCIRIILSTPKRSDPLRPEFASNIFSYVDRPLNIIKPYLVRESIEAITTWEPRIDIVDVSVSFPVEEDIAQADIQITWALKGVAGVTGVTNFILSLG